MMKRMILAVLHEWKFLVLVGVLLYGIVSINDSIQQLANAIIYKSEVSGH